MRRADVELAAKLIHVRIRLKLADRMLVRRDIKTHQQMHIALDVETLAVLAGHMARFDWRAAQLDVVVGADAYPLSLSPDGSTPLIPDTATQRYHRMAKRLGIRTTLHKLRHYSATELIAVGVDIPHDRRTPRSGRRRHHDTPGLRSVRKRGRPTRRCCVLIGSA